MTGSEFFTIGHSNRDLHEFTDLLRENTIEQVVDVRKLPGSSKYPQFNADALSASLGELGVALLRVDALTGRRPVSRTVPLEVNAWWQNRSFHNYADHALSPEFEEALAQLREMGSARRTAVMCSEAVWWRCHRRIVADHLLAANERVTHILGSGQIHAAELSSGAVVGGTHTVTYPAQ